MKKVKIQTKRNNKVIIYSLIGLACVALSFTVSWYFLLPVAVVIWLNQRELMGKN